MTSIERIDMNGRRVITPVQIARVASVSPFITSAVLALGAGDLLVGADAFSISSAKLAALFPSIRLVPGVTTGHAVDRERLVRINPEVILTVTWDHDLEKTCGLGVSVLCIDLDAYCQGVGFLAQLLGKQESAAKYIAYYSTIQGKYFDRLSALPAGVRCKAYVAGKKGLLSTFGKESTWQRDIQNAGGINVAEQTSHADVLTEDQVRGWDPDVIILDASCPDPASAVIADARWRSIKAVQTKRVWRAPDGMLGSWGRPSLESALTRLWLADKFYPGELGIEIESQVTEWYAQVLRVAHPDIHKLLNPE